MVGREGVFCVAFASGLGYETGLGRDSPLTGLKLEVGLWSLGWRERMEGEGVC